MLDIGLDRKSGPLGGFRSPSPRETPVMKPDTLPFHHHHYQQQHWGNSSKSIEATNKRSPIISLSTSSSPSPSSSKQRPGSAKSVVDHFSLRAAEPTRPTLVVDVDDEVSFVLQQQQQHQHQQQQQQTTPTQQNPQSQQRRNSASTPAWVRQQLQELAHSPIFRQQSGSNNNQQPQQQHQHQLQIGRKRKSSASIGTVNREKIAITPITRGLQQGNNNSSSGSNNNNNYNNNNISHNNNSNHNHHQNHHANSDFMTPSPVQFTTAGNALGGSSWSSKRNRHHARITLDTLSTSATTSSPVPLSTSDPVNFLFINKQRDPIREQLRRADAIISALPSKDSAPLPSVIDNTGNPLSSAAVLDGLTKKTTLLQMEHDRSVSNHQKQLHQRNSQHELLLEPSTMPQDTHHEGSPDQDDEEQSPTSPSKQQQPNLQQQQQQQQQQKANKDRTANAIMGIHIAALLDLSRSLAVTDPNASLVVKRVHDVLTSHVVKSVEEPLERVSSLYDQARKQAGEAQERSASLRSQLLDAQAEAQALKRQVRKRDDMIAYLTSAYSLPTVFKDTTSDNKDFVSQTLLEEASPSALLNQKRNADRRRSINNNINNGSVEQGGGSSERRFASANSFGGGRRGSGSGGGGGGADRGDDGALSASNNDLNSWYDPTKSLQEQFQVIIPSQQEKDKKC